MKPRSKIFNFQFSIFKKKRRYFISVLIVFIVLISSAFGFLHEVEATAGINRTINFQGKIVNKADSTNIPNTSYNFTFKLYDDPTAGNQLPTGTPWSETQSITVTDGMFQATLGSSTPIPSTLNFNDDSIYLDITFNGETFGSRVRMTSVPYAMNAEKVGGLTVTNTTGTLTIPNGKTIQFADAFTTSGAFPLTLTVSNTTNATLPAGTIILVDLAASQILTNKTIGSTGLTFSGAATDMTTAANEDLTIAPNGNGRLDVQGMATISANLTLGGQLQLGRFGAEPTQVGVGAMYYNTNTNKFRCFEGAAWADCIGTGGPGSSVWSDLTAPTAALNMNMYQSIGTSFATTFTYGNATGVTNLFNITDSSSNNGTGYLFNLTTASSSTLNPFHVAAAGVEAILVDATGKVGIGNLTPLEKLDVTGNASASGYMTVGQVGGVRAQFGPLNLQYKSSLAGWTTGMVLQDGTGYVGIGSLNPTVVLDVTGAGKFSSNLSASTGNVSLANTSGNTSIGNISGTLALTSSTFNLSAGAVSGVTTLGMNNQLTNTYANSAALYLNANASGITFGGSAANTNTINTSNNNNLYVNLGSGNMGVGNASPIEKLDVTGNASVSGYLTIGQTGALRSQYGPLNFAYKSALNAWTTGMVLQDRTGNVGIGSTNPIAKLDVAGSLNVQGYATMSASLSVGSYNAVAGVGNAVFSGNVGIGTSVPTAKLQLSSSVVGSTLFDIVFNGGSVLSVSDSQIAHNLPTSFNAAGDVSIAYDINFTNPTASYIKSAAPLYLQSGETFNSSDLTLRTFNYGNVVVDSHLFVQSSAVAGKAVAIFDQLENQDVLVASGSGVAKFIVKQSSVQVGTGSAGMNQPLLFGLDIKDTGGDPTGGFEGAMYYNTLDNKFRCYQGSAWTDCIGAGGTPVWSSITAPTAALNMNMYQAVGTSFATTFTYGNATSTTNLFNITDTTSNTGTGYMFNLTTASSSTLNPFHVSSAGVEAVLVNAAGNVGIGNLTPLAKLDVTGTASVSSFLTIGQAGSLRSQFGPLNLAYKSALNAWTTGLVLQDTTGNVGIGALNPGAKLEITSGVANTSGLRFTNLTSSSSTVATNGYVLSVDSSGNVTLTTDQTSVGGTGTLQQSYDTDGNGSSANILMTTDDGSIIFQDIAGTQFQVTMASSTAPTVDMMSILNTGASQSTSTTGVDGLQIDFANSGSSAIDNAGLRIVVSANNTHASSSIEGLSIDTITRTGGGTMEESAIKIGDNWDNDIYFASNSATIKMGDATGEGSEIKFKDANNAVIGTFKEYFANSGYGAFEANGFINIDGSFFQDQFLRQSAQATADVTGVTSRFGDNLRWVFDEAGTNTANTGATYGGCNINQNQSIAASDTRGSTVNGVLELQPDTRVSTTGTYGNMCAVHMGTGTGTNTVPWLHAANKFIMYFKVKPSALWTNTPSAHWVWLGASNYSQAWNGGITYSGTLGAVFLTNVTATAANGAARSQWSGVSRNGTYQASVDCAVDIVTSGYALGRIEARGTSDIRFFMDPDISNGIDIKECGSGLGGGTNTNAIPGTGSGTNSNVYLNPYIAVGLSGGTYSNTNHLFTMYIDFVAFVQDDPRDPPGGGGGGLSASASDPVYPEPPPPDPISGADVAENYYINGDYDIGDIMVSDNAQLGGAKRASTGYDRKLIGVVSESPGLVLGQGAQHSAPIALSGRVPVRVSTASGQIRMGDPITSSNIPGLGVRATKPGKIIGTALENYVPKEGETEGKILVYVNVGYYLGDEGDTALIEQKKEVGVDLNPTEGYTASGEANLEFNATMSAGLSATASAELVPQESIITKLTTFVDQTFFKAPAQFFASVKFQDFVDFMNEVIFRKKVTFENTVEFNKDTAGYAKIKKGARFVDVVFEKEFENEPVVSVNAVMPGMTNEQLQQHIVDGICAIGDSVQECADKVINDLFLQNVKYTVTAKTKQGFMILLEKPLISDITFSWTALAVKDVKMFESKPEVAGEATASAVIETTPVSSPSATLESTAAAGLIESPPDR